jgi:hypothetical protein
MSRRENVETAKQIALIRAIQVERQQMNAQRAAKEAVRARAAETAARTTVDEHAQTLRRVLQAGSGIELNIVSGLGTFIDTAHHRLVSAQADAKQAADRETHERKEHARCQRLADLADQLVSDANVAHTRAEDQRQTDAIEENLRARGVAS